jgi:archaeoflavoprotein AfpA
MPVEMPKTEKQRKIAWGITGGGDRLAETIEVMKQIKKQYENAVRINVFLSKAASKVLKHYKVENDLKENFEKITLELDSNSPFLSGWLQTGIFEFLLIAPATSNTVAKISTGIADSLLSNAAIQALKAFVPVYIMPTDYREGIIYTKLPGERNLKLRIRKEDAEHVRRLEKMDNVFVLENPREILKVFQKHFGSA